MPGSNTQILEVNAHVYLNLSTNDYFRNNATLKI